MRDEIWRIDFVNFLRDPEMSNRTLLEAPSTAERLLVETLIGNSLMYRLVSRANDALTLDLWENEGGSVD